MTIPTGPGNPARAAGRRQPTRRHAPRRTRGTTTFSPTHQYHLGLWFNDPNQPFALGCEPGHTSPIVTPFNGQQDAGIQVLNIRRVPGRRRTAVARPSVTA